VMIRLRLFGVIVTASLATATWAQVGTPLLGYLPAGGYLLPVNGIPASASIAPAINFGGQFIQIAVSPHQDFALVSSADTGAVLLAYPDGTATPITGLAAHPDRIAISPSGSAAVLWYASARKLEIVFGLPASPQVRDADTAFLGNGSGDVPAALAVSDDGAWGAGAWPTGVWAFSANTSRRLVSDRGYALAFYSGRDDLAVATRSGIYSVTDIGGGATVSTLYSWQHAATPAGLAISSDNQTLIMADRAGSIVTFNSATGASNQRTCGCTPDGAIPMGGSVFRITNLTGSVFKVFDANSGNVFMVPLAPTGDPQ